MAAGGVFPLIDVVKRAALRADGTEPADETLLREFIARHDESAFAAVVRRHGPMVLGVCRRVLRNAHDADDAFQATFLVLALKARSLARPEQLGSWLYGVAWRTAQEARSAAARRRRKESAVAATSEPLCCDAEPVHDLRPLLDRELAALPDRYRGPIVLCDLEGWSRKDAARQLRVKEGTLSSRLATGRRMLAARLSRQGLRLGAVGLATLLAQEALARVPSEGITKVVHAAAALVDGSSLETVAAAEVVSLTRKVVQAMYVSQIKMPLMAVAAALVMIAGLVSVSQLDLVAPAAAQPLPPGVPNGFPGQPTLADTKGSRFPAPANAKAFVARHGDAGLKLRAELPMGRFMKLIDADGKQAHVHEFVHYQPPAFTVELKDARVFDARGRSRSVEDWAKGLKEETLVLLEFRDGDIDAKEFAHTFRLFRNDLTVLVVPTATMERVDKSLAFGPAKSLPQSFPGAPGGLIPPPKPGSR